MIIIFDINMEYILLLLQLSLESLFLFSLDYQLNNQRTYNIMFN